MKTTLKKIAIITASALMLAFLQGCNDCWNRSCDPCPKPCKPVCKPACKPVSKPVCNPCEAPKPVCNTCGSSI